MSEVAEFVGKIYGKWLIESVVRTNDSGEKVYKCVCTCGTEVEKRESVIRNKNSLQCQHCARAQQAKMISNICKRGK